MTKKKLVFENTYFSLFVFFLYDKEWKHYDYFLWGNRFNQDFARNLAKYVSVLDVSYQCIPRLITKSGDSLFKYYRDKNRLRNVLNTYTDCIGNVREINHPFVTIKNRIQIDDGVGTTQFELINGPKSKLSLFDCITLREGEKIKKTREFILTKEIDVKPSYRDICSFIDISSRWGNLCELEKKEILEVFDVSSEDLKSIDNKSTILFTQPFSENRSDYTELDKVEGYRKLIASRGVEETNLVIKPHPAEKTDYSIYFPGSIIIKPSFPAELMPLLGVEVDKVISVATNAAECFKEHCNAIYYSKGSEFFSFPESLKNKLNSMELKSWIK